MNEKINRPVTDYTGGKAGAGVYQAIINRIPAHKIFVELFAGGCGISSNMVHSDKVILNDIDIDVYNLILKVLNGKSQMIAFNYSYEVLLNGLTHFPGVFFYADPPYLIESRSTKRKYYKHDWDIEEHQRFLYRIIDAGSYSSIMVSHYRCEMYDTALYGWNKHEFKAMTRGGLRDECIYFNYDVPSMLQDDSYTGEDFTDRQRIKRKADRVIKKFLSMSAAERQFILTKVINTFKEL